MGAATEVERLLVRLVGDATSSQPELFTINVGCYEG